MTKLSKETPDPNELFIYNNKLNNAPKTDIPATASPAPNATAAFVEVEAVPGVVAVPPEPVPLADVPSADLASEVVVQVNLPWMTDLSFWKPEQSI